ncbi:MAG: hypothetical protein E7422_04655 [Ruminococcaceae bacterium]|nr:hypothetical protein [Oscillospiraceae bacterium]
MKNNPGEWREERNQWGGVRRFRMVGNVKEYEMMVSVDGMQIPESELEDYHRHKKEREAAAAELRKAAPPTRQLACPFGGGGHSCAREKCALFTGDGCTLAQITTGGTGSTAGKSCPFSPYPCRNDCGLYKNGCVLTAIEERT